MTVAIHGKKIHPDVEGDILKIFSRLQARKVEVAVSRKFRDLNTNIPDISAFKTFDQKVFPETEIAFSLGGDGTLLETVTYIGSKETPIVGINTGRLGFLATISKHEIDSCLDILFDKRYKIDKRSLIHLDSDKEIFGDLNFALNEIAIMKRDTSSMIVVKCYIDDEYLNTYWADGLMVSTPTGSTGYSLSCGGPVVLPHSGNFIITPVCPHNLNVRPLVISENSSISFHVESRGRHFLISLDSRSYKVDETINLSVRKENFKANLIMFDGNSFLKTLRSKLNWGLDIRN